jgi:hypothetical protein
MVLAFALLFSPIGFFLTLALLSGVNEIVALYGLIPAILFFVVIFVGTPTFADRS